MTLTVRHHEHIRYIKTNNLLSACAMHIINNQREYGNPERTLQLLQPCQKGKFMNCWKSLVYTDAATTFIDGRTENQ